MTRRLTPDLRLSRRWRARLEWKAADLWVGLFHASDGDRRDVWICLLPCLPVHFWTIRA